MDSQGLDRLLPRHEVAPAMSASLEWDIRERRMLWKRDEESFEATVLNLSLEGALIEAPSDSAHQVGDVVSVRLGEIEGDAIIRHAQRNEDDTSWLYGVAWGKGPELRAAVAAGVEQLRDSNSELRRNWEGQRR